MLKARTRGSGNKKLISLGVRPKAKNIDKGKGKNLNETSRGPEKLLVISIRVTLL